MQHKAVILLYMEVFIKSNGDKFGGRAVRNCFISSWPAGEKCINYSKGSLHIICGNKILKC